MAPPEIAVIITCHDLGATLGEALDSVRGQTLTPAEVVIVDDGSTDVRTRQLLARLGSSGEQVVRTANRGVSAARNLGAVLTRSPCIVHLDADDILRPTYLERTVSVLEERPDLGFVTTSVEAFGAASFTWSPARPTLVEAMAFGVPHISSLMRRSLWQAVGGYDESIRVSEELDFWTTVLAMGFAGELVDEPLLRYRVRADSLYHRAIRPHAYVEIMAGYYRRHRATVAEHGEEILLAKERF